MSGFLDNQVLPLRRRAAFQATDDRTFLREAMEKYPTDPRLNYVAWFRSQSPEERRQWLDAFKQSAPDNAFADYLSARDYFKSGQNDQAVQELLVAVTKPIQDYSLDFVQNGEEAYRAAGYSDAEAKMVATSTLLLPQLAEYKQVITQPNKITGPNAGRPRRSLMRRHRTFGDGLR